MARKHVPCFETRSSLRQPMQRRLLPTYGKKTPVLRSPSSHGIPGLTCPTCMGYMGRAWGPATSGHAEARSASAAKLAALPRPGQRTLETHTRPPRKPEGAAAEASARCGAPCAGAARAASDTTPERRWETLKADSPRVPPHATFPRRAWWGRPRRLGRPRARAFSLSAHADSCFASYNHGRNEAGTQTSPCDNRPQTHISRAELLALRDIPHTLHSRKAAR